jgi:uncharacterized protein (TIGR04222 family)
MDVLAAAGNTWGISGPRFLGVYALLFVGVLVAVRLLRLRPTAGRSDVPPPDPRELHPYELAYLNGGPTLAANAALAGLRAAGVLTTGGGRHTVAVCGPLPSNATPLDRAAVLVASGGQQPVRSVRRDLAARPEMVELADRLRWRGLLMSDEQRSAYRSLGLLWVALLVLGLARALAGASRGKPIGFLVFCLLVTAVVTAASLLRVPRATRPGQKTLAAARAVSGGRATAASTGATMFGATGAAYGVALFGLGALWASDPEFAAGIGVPRHTTDVSGGGGGGSCGGGSSCGGGGGCGGGGCGG